jgi:hypothetical protein
MGALTKIALRFDGERLRIRLATDRFDREGERALFDFECWPLDRNLIITYVGGDRAGRSSRAARRRQLRWHWRVLQPLSEVRFAVISVEANCARLQRLERRSVSPQRSFPYAAWSCDGAPTGGSSRQ